MSPRPREELVAASPWEEGTSCWERWSIGGWEVEEGAWDFVCSSKVLEVGFWDWLRLVCWFGWEGAERSMAAENGREVFKGGE